MTGKKPRASGCRRLRLGYGFWLSLCLLVQGGAAAETLPEAETAKWLHYYYQNPQPQQFVARVEELAASGALSSESRSRALQVFLATLLAQHGSRIETWMEALSDLPEVDRESLYLALWRADTDPARTWLAQHQVLTAALPPPQVSGQSIRTAQQVEMLWHRFYATGDWALVRQLVAVLAPADQAPVYALSAAPQPDPEQRQAQREQLETLVLWSLDYHARRHPQVLEVLGQMARQGQLNLRQQTLINPLLEELAPGRYVRVDDIAVE